MLEGRTRVPPVDVETLPDDLREVLEEQGKRWGAPLYPYLYCARNPAYFRAAHGMWMALQQETTRCPVRSRGCSIVASRRGLAACFDRTPMLP